MSNTQDSVLPHFQTPRTASEILCYTSYFDLLLEFHALQGAASQNMLTNTFGKNNEEHLL